MSELPTQPVRRVALRFALPCDLASVRPAILAVRSFLGEQGVSPEELTTCELVLAEACNNAIQYVRPSAQQQLIAVEAICDDSRIELRVEDHTPGFDWPKDLALPDAEKERGRGLYLIRVLMDQTAYLRGASDNCLVMHKLRRNPMAVPPPPDAAGKWQELARRLKEDERIIRDMAEELSSCYESLSAIFRYSAEQSRAASLDDFSRRLFDDMLRVTGNDWYVFRLVPPAQSQLTVFAASEPTLYLEPILLRLEADEKDPLELKAAVTRHDVWFESRDSLAPADPLARVRAGSDGMVHPVCLGDVLIGTLAVGGASRSTRFTAARTSVIHTFADFLAIQIVNTRFHEERLTNLLVARELEIAQQIQRSLLPRSLPQPPGMELAGYCESASQVGGDFYDAIRLSDTTMLLMISDVMGKGIPAAMFAVILRSLVRALREHGSRPGELLRRINQLLYEELSRVEMFITAQLAFIDAKARRFVTANAGHCPVLMCPAKGANVKVISPDGLPLGVMLDTVFPEESVAIENDSRFLLYTDGLTEAGNPDGELFGQSRLMDWLSQASVSCHSAVAMKAKLTKALLQFQGNQVLSDDQTFLILAG